MDNDGWLSHTSMERFSRDATVRSASQEGLPHELMQV